MPQPPEHRHRTIEYGNRPSAQATHDRTGLPDDCPCPAVRWCGRPPHIARPEPDCRHHGRAAYRLPTTAVVPFRRKET